MQKVRRKNIHPLVWKFPDRASPKHNMVFGASGARVTGAVGAEQAARRTVGAGAE